MMFFHKSLFFLFLLLLSDISLGNDEQQLEQAFDRIDTFVTRFEQLAALEKQYAENIKNVTSKDVVLDLIDKYDELLNQVKSDMTRFGIKIPTVDHGNENGQVVNDESPAWLEDLPQPGLPVTNSSSLLSNENEIKGSRDESVLDEHGPGKLDTSLKPKENNSEPDNSWRSDSPTNPIGWCAVFPYCSGCTPCTPDCTPCM